MRCYALMVVMRAWLCDIAFSAVLNSGRFDLGFYAGRVYGLAASIFVLIVLQRETGRLYAQLADVPRWHAQSTPERTSERSIDAA